MEKTLDSGAVLNVTMAPFKDGNDLRKAVLRELETVRISFDLDIGKVKEIFTKGGGDEVVNAIKNLILKLASSEEIEARVWKCLERATYDNVKITKETFEPEAARGDYLIVLKEVLWFNLSPFFKNLSSMLPDLGAVSNTASQK